MITSAPLRYGYTMGDLNEIARVAVNVAYGQAMDYRDRYDAAWHAIAEHLCTAEQRPTWLALKNTGVRAVERVVQDDQRHRGFNRNEPGAGRPRFERYWALSRATPSPEEAIVDRIALTQIWPALSSTHQQILTAFAALADHHQAAEATGRTLATYRVHLGNARRAYRALWHEHEVPSVMWSQSRSHIGTRSATWTLANRSRQRARRATVEEGT